MIEENHTHYTFPRSLQTPTYPIRYRTPTGRTTHSRLAQNRELMCLMNAHYGSYNHTSCDPKGEIFRVNKRARRGIPYLQKFMASYSSRISLRCPRFASCPHQHRWRGSLALTSESPLALLSSRVRGQPPTWCADLVFRSLFAPHATLDFCLGDWRISIRLVHPTAHRNN